MNSWDSLTWGHKLHKVRNRNQFYHQPDYFYVAKSLYIAEQVYSENSISCLHRYFFCVCVLYHEKIPWAYTFGFFSRIRSELQTPAKTMYSSHVFWKVSRHDKEKANHVINGTDRHDNQEIAFNYFGCKHYMWSRDLLCQAMYEAKLP